MFKNRENPVYMIDGKEFWHSRSCAVSMMLTCKKEGKTLYLLGKRGPSMSHQNKWGMPCGYIDWDENGYDAARRETWEEAGILIPEGDKSPWHVDTVPKNFLQNVTLHYEHELNELVEPSNKNCGSEEVLESKWFSLSEIISMDDSEFAFGHNKLIIARGLKNKTVVIEGNDGTGLCCLYKTCTKLDIWLK